MKNDILVSHSGKQHSYKVALALQKMGFLNRFITSSYYKPSKYPDKFFSYIEPIDRIFRRRYEYGLAAERVTRLPLLELPEALIRLVSGNSKIASDATCIRDALFDSFVAKTQIKDCRIFWGFQGSCLESLKAAKNKGVVAVVEFATAHIKTALKILGKERIRNPDWADSISNLYFPDWYLRRLEEEPFAADYCIAASGFTKNTLQETGVKEEKILTLPLGVDLTKFQFVKRNKKDSLQLIFVGGIGQRKGIKYLLDALKMINSDKIKLKMVGPIVGSGKALEKYSKYYEYVGKLGRDALIKEMSQSDCLVLPSLFEGFGLVIPEAMATGMPVIASANSAAPEIIRPGIDGFVVAPCDSAILAEKIEWLMSHKNRIAEMGKDAAVRAREFSWDAYAGRLKTILERLSA